MGEVLVGSLIGLALLGTMLVMYLQVSSSGRLGQSRLAIQLRARQAMRRVIPWVRFATAPNTAQSGLYAPDLSATASNVVFCTPEDPLIDSIGSFDPRNPSYFLMQIRHSGSRLIMEDFYTPARSQLLANDIAAFNVTRTHELGVLIRIRTEARVRDSRGQTRTVDYQIEEALEVPE